MEQNMAILRGLKLIKKVVEAKRDGLDPNEALKAEFSEISIGIKESERAVVQKSSGYVINALEVSAADREARIIRAAEQANAGIGKNEEILDQGSQDVEQNTALLRGLELMKNALEAKRDGIDPTDALKAEHSKSIHVYVDELAYERDRANEKTRRTMEIVKAAKEKLRRKTTKSKRKTKKSSLSKSSWRRPSRRLRFLLG